MNAKSCWIPTEVSSTTRQVKHPRPNTQRTRQNVYAGSLLFKGESDAVKEEMKIELNELIVSVFRKRPTLNYYQVRALSLPEGYFTDCWDIGIPRYHQCVVSDLTA